MSAPPAVLNEHGGCIGVFELEGPVFFGSADQIAARLLQETEDGLTYVILDCRRVSDIDSTGARILQQTSRLLGSRGAQMCLSHVQPGTALWEFLEGMGVVQAVGEAHFFVDTDRALEWCEDRLLEKHLGKEVLDEECPLENQELWGGLSGEELEVVTGILERAEYGQGDFVFRQGDPGDSVFTIRRGSATVTVHAQEEGQPAHDKRLISFGPGTVFGEMALLDGQPRSADVQAAEPLVCHILTREGFDRLCREHPELSLKIYANLGRSFAQRMRSANAMILELER